MKSFKSAGLPEVSSAGLLSSCGGLEIDPAPPAGDHTALQPIHTTSSFQPFLPPHSTCVHLISPQYDVTALLVHQCVSLPHCYSLSFTFWHVGRFQTPAAVEREVDFLSSVVQSEERTSLVQTYATHYHTLVLIPCECCVRCRSEPRVCCCFGVTTIAHALRRHFLCATSVCHFHVGITEASRRRESVLCISSLIGATMV